MMHPFSYEFGYTWWVAWGHVVPIAIGALLITAAIRLSLSRWWLALAAIVLAWGIAGLLITQFLFRLNLPVALPDERFMAAGTGRVVDIGAGSGRATVGLLLARPQVKVTAVDIYRGYFGIDDNTPERLMRNARIARVADRAEAKVGDARQLPLDSGAYDGAISVAAIDHLPRTDIPKALAEVARVLKPGGEFLLGLVNPDPWVLFVSPPLAHHPRPNVARWKELLAAAGFVVEAEGRQPGTLFFRSRRRGIDG